VPFRFCCLFCRILKLSKAASDSESIILVRALNIYHLSDIIYSLLFARVVIKVLITEMELYTKEDIVYNSFVKHS